MKKKKSNLKKQIIKTIVAFVAVEAAVSFMAIIFVEKLFF